MKRTSALLLAMIAIPAGLALADEPSAVVVEELVIEQDVVEAAVETKAAEAKADAAKEEGEGQEQAKPSGQEPTEAELREKMRELEQELQNTRNKLQQQAYEKQEKIQKQAAQAMEDIKLPNKPTREQCEAYVALLRKACEGRDSYSSSDPVTDKLKKIPAEHLDLLLTEMADRTSLRYYANYAMRGFDLEKLREQIVKAIDDNPKNIGVIVMQGWGEDVRPAIIKKIRSADGTVSPAWFQAAVDLDESSLYPKLHEITTQSRYADQFISMLETLPDYDLANTIDACWLRAKEGKLSVSYTSFAGKAAAYGNVDALGSLVDQLSFDMSYSSSYNVRRINVLRLIDYRGSNQDIQDWYKTNKDKLVFDRSRKRFVVPEDF